ncbi:MAG TPA: type II secretion system F family protein [Actinomycetota bacterium]|nr:type II secretion system F family protein [Actinomycetota bacterium]
MTPLLSASLISFAALAIVFGIVFTGRSDREAVKKIERRIKLYSIGARGKRTRTKGVLADSPVARRAVDLVDKLPRNPKRDKALAAQLERAGWPLRPAEMIAIRLAAAAGAGLALAVLLGNPIAGPIAAGVAYLIPKAALDRAVAKRTNAFLMQLPDTLQLLAGSLKAGYGLVQAVDTLVKETPAPTSTEFSRVLAETRLGMPLEESLTQMAERIGSEDFRWVVMAIAIQRQVGGNLADLLTTVAATLRDREAVRRQVKVLSAEGRLSAYILIGLPFGIAGYVAMVNPEFLESLTGERVGQIMIAASLVLMGIGAAWMRKIIKIEV